MAHPHTPHPCRRNEDPTLGQFVRHPELAVGRLFQGQHDDGILDFRLDPIFRQRLPTTDLVKSQFATGVVKFPEPIEAVAGIPHHLAGLADAAEGFGEFQKP